MRYGDGTARRGFPQVTEPLTRDEVFWMFSEEDPSRAASKLRPRQRGLSTSRTLPRWEYRAALACFRLESDLGTPGSGVDFAGRPSPTPSTWPRDSARISSPPSRKPLRRGPGSEESEAALGGAASEPDDGSASERDSDATV